MSADPRAALNTLVAALERHLEASSARRGEDDPAVIAAYDRLRNGKEPVAPRDDLGHAANFLYMLDGKEPDADAVSAIDLDFLHTSHLARGTKHHHLEAIARKPAGTRANHILEPTLGIGKVGTIDVQDSNHRLATRFVAPRFATGHEYGEKRLCEGKFRWIPHPSRMVAAARPVICATP